MNHSSFILLTHTLKLLHTHRCLTEQLGTLFQLGGGVWGDWSPVWLARMARTEPTGLSGSLWVPGGLLWVSSPESINAHFLTHCVKHLNPSVDVWITNDLNGKNMYFQIFF